MSGNLTWHEHEVSLGDRRELLGFENRVYWFTGLSGSGKSTLANALAAALHSDGELVYVLDGDNVRHGLNSDLGFSLGERSENIRRVAEVAKLMYDAGITVLVAFISPLREDRAFARELIGEDFIEVFVDAPLAVCEKRDPKGLYAKARRGEIVDMTGIDSAYEVPLQAEVTVDADSLSVQDSVSLILDL